MHSVIIETTSGNAQFQLNSGEVTLIVGPNGVGKSALLQDIYRKCAPGQVSYFPGHRSITFSHGYENMQMSLVDLDINLFSQFDGFNRHKSMWPEEQFKSVLRRLQNSQVAYTQELFERLKAGGDSSSLLAEKAAPIQLLNTVFETAKLSVRIKFTDSGLVAVRNNVEYPIDRMSDGERAALFLCAAIVNRRSGGIIIIDEPERHLHPSISAPLISAAVRSRPNVAFVFASH